MTDRTLRGFSIVTGEQSADREEALILGAIAGDGQAFEELYRRHSKRVFRTALRILRNPEDAEDVVQDSFIRAYRHLPSFNRTCAFSTWVTRIGINSALMLLRRHRKTFAGSPIKPNDSENHPIEDLVETSPSPEDFALYKESAKTLAVAIRRLPPPLREAISFRCYQGATTKEAAIILGLTETTVKTRLFRARSRLRPVILKERRRERLIA